MNVHVIVVEPGVVRTDMYRHQGPAVQRLLDAMSTTERALYEPLYVRYRDVVGGAEGLGATDTGISVAQCAADIEAALLGEDARRMVAMVKQMTDLEMDAVIHQRVNNTPLPQ